LVIKTIPEDLTRLAAFKTGAVDLIDAVPVASLEEVRRMPGVKTATLNTGNNIYFNFASDLPGSPFRDIRVRRAAAHAIDLDAIIRRVLFGQGERYVEIGAGSFGHDPEIRPIPYDPRRARELLREAGYPNGFDTPCYNMTTPREPNIKEFGEAVFAYLTAVGIRCRVRGLEYNAWLRTVRHDPDPAFRMDGIINAMYGHGIPGDPGTAWGQMLHSYTPGAGWGASSRDSDPEVDGLIAAQRAEMDPARREPIIRRIARLKHERMLGGLSMYRPLQTFAWRDKVQFIPWANPGIWHQMQQVGLATQEAR
jgi:peptide/nickel transport system substrate-binding protein